MNVKRHPGVTGEFVATMRDTTVALKIMLRQGDSVVLATRGYRSRVAGGKRREGFFF